jgi:hypothetical protein
MPERDYGTELRSKVAASKGYASSALWVEPFEFGLRGPVFDKGLWASLSRHTEERFGIGLPALEDVPFAYVEVGFALLIRL